MKTKHSNGDMTPVLGGSLLPEDIENSINAEDAKVPDDELGQMIFWLMRLHKDKLSLKFRNSDIAGMDEKTKQLLIDDIHIALGIRSDFGDIL
jgi:hypothetical protein